MSWHRCWLVYWSEFWAMMLWVRPSMSFWNRLANSTQRCWSCCSHAGPGWLIMLSFLVLVSRVVMRARFSFSCSSILDSKYVIQSKSTSAPGSLLICSSSSSLRWMMQRSSSTFSSAVRNSWFCSSSPDINRSSGTMPLY